MKRLSIMVALLMLLSIGIYAQNKEPEKMRFAYNHNNPSSNTFVFDITLPEFKQDSFLLGWQWSNHAKIGQALLMNSSAEKFEGASVRSGYSQSMPVCMSGYQYTPPCSSRCFIYEPTLKLTSPQKESLPFLSEKMTRQILFLALRS